MAQTIGSSLAQLKGYFHTLNTQLKSNFLLSFSIALNLLSSMQRQCKSFYLKSRCLRDRRKSIAILKTAILVQPLGRTHCFLGFCVFAELLQKFVQVKTVSSERTFTKKFVCCVALENKQLYLIFYLLNHPEKVSKNQQSAEKWN